MSGFMYQQIKTKSVCEKCHTCKEYLNYFKALEQIKGQNDISNSMEPGCCIVAQVTK